MRPSVVFGTHGLTVTRHLVARTSPLAMLVLVGLSYPLAAQRDAAGEADALGPWHAAEMYGRMLTGSEPSPTVVIGAAQAELALGRASRALKILTDNPMPDSSLGGAAARVYALAVYRNGRYEEAAVLFARAAQFARGIRRGVLFAQAGEASERAGFRHHAEEYYRMAEGDLEEIAGWVALRRAKVARDTAEAFRLLRRVPSPGAALADLTRAELFEWAADTSGAIAAYTKISRYQRAAELSLAVGDSVWARGLLYSALVSGPRDERGPAAALAFDLFHPENPAEYLVLARALRANRRAKDAAKVYGDAVANGDSSVSTLIDYGEALSASRDRWGALRAYQRGALRGETESAEAMYRRASLLVSMRQRSARQALRTFLDTYPDHARAPEAVYLMAAVERRAGRRATADSLYRTIADNWPDHSRASRARMLLVDRALARGDTADAVDLLEAEVAAEGSQANVARFTLGRLAAAAGDASRAAMVWTALARRDSVGYYGTIARRAAGLPEPRFSPPEPMESQPRIRKIFAELDMLNAAGFQPEGDAVVEALMDPESDWSTPELIQIAEGLNARDRTAEGIRLGWRLTRELSLNHPRVIRIIFPWPHRNLIERKAEENGLDPFLVAGMIRQESAFRPAVVSRAGARGMMQLMPSTARGLARRLRLEWDFRLLSVPDANIHMGTYHLSALLRQYDQELIPALAAYNAGGRPVARWLRMPEARDPFLFVERIPYLETRGYVRTLIRNRALYTALYGQPATPLGP